MAVDVAMGAGVAEGAMVAVEAGAGVVAAAAGGTAAVVAAPLPVSVGSVLLKEKLHELARIANDKKIATRRKRMVAFIPEFPSLHQPVTWYAV